MFSTWMIGFLLLMAALVWLAVVVGLPQPFIGLAVGVLLVLVLVLAVGVTAAVIRRQRRPRRPLR